MTSQVLSTLSNFLITVLVARTMGIGGLGQFAVAFAFYLMVLGLARALVSDPLLASNRSLAQADWSASVTLTAMLGTAGAVCAATVGWALDRPALVVVAIAIPITLLQDLMRFQAFQAKRPGVAVVLDAGWVVGILGSWPILIASPSPNVAVACWGGSAAVGVLLASFSIPLQFASPRAALAWWQENARDLALPMLAECLLYHLFAQTQVYVVAAWAGDEGLGLLRAGQVLFGPLSSLLTAVSVFALPQLAQRSVATTTRAALTLAATSGGVAIVSCSALLGIAPVLQPVLFGDASVPYKLLIPLALQFVLGAVGTMLIAVSKARREGTVIAVSRLISTIAGIVGVSAATAWFGVVGAAWAVVVQTILFVALLGVRVSNSPARAGSLANAPPI